ncbi:MAG: Ppx/GppA family phosphatase [Bacteroidetes bacterium]|nr:MAG: Ppx/GppA family phosphatase [Bacteroidota bacterium]
MIAAIIDCGTNTFNLLISEFQINEQPRIILNTKKSVKLGEGGLKDNNIAPAAFQRGVKTFLELVNISKDYKVDTVHAFATSAVRSSKNGHEFVKKIFEKTGIMVQVLNGDTEAQYIFKGVNLAIENMDEPSLIMDIGGGSTEFIIAEEQEVVWKKSFDLGATRLMQEFKPSDPVSTEDIEKIKVYLKEMLQPLALQLKKNPVRNLIGCSGSFESLADMIIAQKPQGSSYDKLYSFDDDDFKSIHKQLVASTEADRKIMPGLVEYRVDTIVFASIFIRYIKKRFKIDQMFYSSYALKEGVLADLILHKIAL